MTRRSSPAKEKYPYDMFSFIDGKGAILIDTALYGLKGKFPNENTLYEINVSGRVQDVVQRDKHHTVNLLCVYSNYAFHLKSKKFDHVEKHL